MQKTRTPTSGKKPLSAVYQDGAKALFVPLPWMWSFHQASRESPSASILRRIRSSRAKYRAGQSPGLSSSHVRLWLRRFAESPWFAAWLMEGKKPPDAVRIATPTQIERCRLAWDYTRLARAGRAISTVETFHHWFKDDVIPRGDDGAWIPWLWGEQEPHGYIIIDEQMERVQWERSIKGVCKAAGVSEATYWAWTRSHTERALLQALLDNDGDPPPGWVVRHPLARDSMLRYAKSARFAACLVRAGVTRKRFDAWLARADKLNCGEAIREFLNGGNPRAYGCLAPALFRPGPSMLDFRHRARREMARRGVWRFLKALPAWQAWMVDWCTPRPNFRRRSRTPAGGNASQSTTNGAVEASPTSNGSAASAAPNAVYILPAPRRKRGGQERPESRERNQRILHCYGKSGCNGAAEFARTPVAVANGWTRHDVGNAIKWQQKRQTAT